MDAVAGEDEKGVEYTKKDMYISIMDTFGYTPNQIAEMTIEQMKLCFDGDSPSRREEKSFRNQAEAIRYLQGRKALRSNG